MKTHIDDLKDELKKTRKDLMLSQYCHDDATWDGRIEDKINFVIAFALVLIADEMIQKRESRYG